MTEHVHVLGQGFNIAYMEEYVWCIKCKRKWSKAEVAAMLNEYETLKAATERLSAEDAMTLYHSAPQRSSEDFHRKDALFDYANILEGKDERTKPIR